MKYVIDGFQIEADDLKIANYKLELARNEFNKSQFEGVNSDLKHKMIQVLINNIDETGEIKEGFYFNLIVKDRKAYRQKDGMVIFESNSWNAYPRPMHGKFIKDVVIHTDSFPSGSVTYYDNYIGGIGENEKFLICSRFGTLFIMEIMNNF